jgi:FkbM family methyltransferase
MRFSQFIFRKPRYIIEALTNTELAIKIRPRVRTKVHKYAISDGRSMALYADLVDKLCSFQPTNIFEIGANYAQDAEYLRKRFKLTPSDVFVFEPHPEIISAVKSLYSFRSYDVAVANYNGTAKFNAIDVSNNEYRNSGISSLREGLTTNPSNFYQLDVTVIRMDEFIERHDIKNIDFLKIDVEGVNYDVLLGFGEKLSCVKCIQIEGERIQYWAGQHLYDETERLLKQNDFELVYFLLSGDGVQSDSFWVRKPYLAKGVDLKC